MTMHGKVVANGQSLYIVDGQWLYIGLNDRGHYYTTLIAMRDRDGVCFPLMPYEWLTQEFVDNAFKSMEKHGNP